MKKFVALIISAALFCGLFSGCSFGISLESYDSVTEENSFLQSQNSSYSSEVSALNEKSAELKSENEKLKEENSKLQDKVSQSSGSENYQIDSLRYDVFTKRTGTEVFIEDSSRNKWYFDGTNVFVSYLEENNYSSLPDDDVVSNMFNDIAYCTKRYLSNIPLYLFFIADKNGNYVARGFLSFILMGEDNNASVGLTWYDDYERLNSNSKQIEMLAILSKQPSQTESRPSESSSSTTDIVVTTGKKNALRTARKYLDITAFSYSRLISQLEYEGYSYEEAKYGADNCGADWYEQAAKSAKKYLELTSFSRSGLIDQLEYEGFTHSQAVYGVTQNGY